MRYLIVGLLLFTTPAFAQSGLTPAAQIGSLCKKAMKFRALGHGDGTAINNACGSSAALATTIAGGRASFDALSALVTTARNARNTRLQSATP